MRVELLKPYTLKADHITSSGAVIYAVRLNNGGYVTHHCPPLASMYARLPDLYNDMIGMFCKDIQKFRARPRK